MLTNREHRDRKCVDGIRIDSRKNGYPICICQLPEVQDVCFFLESLGVKSRALAPPPLWCTVLKKIDQPITHFLSEDPIVNVLSLHHPHQIKLTITRCPIDFLEIELLKLEKWASNTKS